MHRYFSKKEYAEIAEAFGFGKVLGIKRFRKGYQTPKVICRTRKGMFVISRHKISERKDIISKSKKSLSYEIALLNALPRLPVPHHVPLRNGGYILDFKGHAITAYEFLPGIPPERITSRMVHQLGKFLGTFHMQGKKFHGSLIGRRKFYDLTPAVIKKMSVWAEKQRNSLLKSVMGEVQAGVERTRPPARLPRGPVHVDIKSENELFVGRKLTGVVDFGNFYVGPYMVDFGKTVMWNCAKGDRLDIKLVRAFKKGYELRRRLSRSEKAYLKDSILFAIYSHIFVDLYHVPLGYVPEKYAVFLVKNFLPVARWMEMNGLSL